MPFITRYRKERTGGLDETQIRRIQARVKFLRDLAGRKQTILKSVANQGRLTDDFVDRRHAAAESQKRLDDLYLPFKVKKKTLASEARDKGLEPLATAIYSRDPAVENLAEILPGMVDGWKQLHDVNDVLTGVRHILAETVAETAAVRGQPAAIPVGDRRTRQHEGRERPRGQGVGVPRLFRLPRGRCARCRRTGCWR